MISAPLAAFDIASSSVLISMMAYSAFRALQVRASLSLGLYRRQALWTTAISTIFAVLLFVDYVFIYVLPYNSWVDLVVSVVQGGSVFALFGWIDTSTLITRRSDPLLRNTIRWSTLRRPIWALLLVSYVLALGDSASGIAVGGSLAGRAPPLVEATLSAVLLVPFALGAVLIPLDARRTGDLILRRHLRWLGLLVFSVFGIALLYGSLLALGEGIGFLSLSQALFSLPESNVAFVSLGMLFGYAMIRSARSLAPVNRLSIEVQSNQGT